MAVECSEGSARQFTEVNALNSKLGYDFAAQFQNQGLTDNQSDARAWAELRLAEARDSQRIKHLSEVSLLVAEQTGETEDQQNTSPVDQATSEAIKASAGVSADAVTASVANLLTSTIPVIASSLASAIAQTLIAVLPSVVAASGTAAGTSNASPTPAA